MISYARRYFNKLLFDEITDRYIFEITVSNVEKLIITNLIILQSLGKIQQHRTSKIISHYFMKDLVLKKHMIAHCLNRGI